MEVIDVLDVQPDLEYSLWKLYRNYHSSNILMFVRMRVLVLTDENTDHDGSFYAQDGSPANFTYRDATYDDVVHATSAGYWNCFGRYEHDLDVYTGNQYEIDGVAFPAIVLDPPVYAQEVYF